MEATQNNKTYQEEKKKVSELKIITIITIIFYTPQIPIFFSFSQFFSSLYLFLLRPLCILRFLMDSHIQSEVYVIHTESRIRTMDTCSGIGNSKDALKIHGGIIVTVVIVT